MDKFFKISERGSSLRKEIVGGVTTFFAMAYIIFVNPNTLCTQFEDGFCPAMPAELWGSVMLATCLSAVIGCVLTALLANAPFAQAPGMGLNAFFTFTCCLTMGFSWQETLAIVLMSGALFLIIALSPLRSHLISAIPSFLKNAISAGIGLFIALIGLTGAGVVDLHGPVPALTLFVDQHLNYTALVCIIGLLVAGILMAYKVKGAMLIGIIVSTLVALPLGVADLPEDGLTMAIPSLSPVFMQMDFSGAFSHGILPLLTAVVSFFLVDCFDTVGTLIGTAANAGMLDKNGALPGGDRALIADAVATCAGACLGTSTVTTFVESASGIAEGARTGLSTLVVALLFALAIPLAPIAGIVPAAATAPALIIVGVLMMGNAGNIDWKDIESAIPSFLTISMMPFAYSISDGIGFGFISFMVIKLARGKAKEVPALVYIISILFIIKYVLTGRVAE